MTVINNSGDDWQGSVVIPERGEVLAVREYIADEDAPWTRSSGKIGVAGQVPAYDVKVYAVEFAPPAPAPAAAFRFLVPRAVDKRAAMPASEASRPSDATQQVRVR